MRTSVRIGGQFCCSFIANLLQYLCAKNYRNIMWLDELIAKIKRMQFFATQCRVLLSKIENNKGKNFKKKQHTLPPVVAPVRHGRVPS